MICHRETRIVPYPAELMYAVVADVERYPEFLPWVLGLRMLSRGENRMTAEMMVGYGALREHYTSEIALDPAARAKGFLMVSASPLTRSSYHADSDFAELKKARVAKAG